MNSSQSILRARQKNSVPNHPIPQDPWIDPPIEQMFLEIGRNKKNSQAYVFSLSSKVGIMEILSSIVKICNCN